ncbi:MAG: hypothetical protein ABR861_04960 [Terriglobales bacterium]|jgi:hypothetical protein
MSDPGLAAVLRILDRSIAELEEWRTRQIEEVAAAASSLSEVEDIYDDPRLQLIDQALPDLKLLRKKVEEGKTS